MTISIKWSTSIGRKVPALLAIFFLVAPHAVASDVKSMDEITEAMHSICTISEAEPVQSLGSLGISLGVGSQWTPAEHVNSQYQQMLTLGTQETGMAQANYVSISKGLPWPLNVGVVVGSLKSTGTVIIGGHLDVVAFEQFQWPTFGIRARAQTISGAEDTKFSMTAIAASVAYSYSLFTAFVGAESSQNRLTFQPTTPSQFAVLANVNQPGALTANRQINDYTAGIRVQIIPGTANLTVEAKQSDFRVPSLNVKLALGI